MRPRDRHGAGALAASLAAAIVLVACGGRNEQEAAAVTPSNVTLSADQRQHIHLYTVTPGKFRRTVDANGAVDFDNDQATSVLAAVLRPGVAKLLVEQGDQVKAGDALAVIDSPDFAEAISAYRKAIVKRHRPTAVSPTSTRTCSRTTASREREAAQAETDAVSAEADRDAALQALRRAAGESAGHQGHPGRAARSRTPAAIIRSPDRGHGGRASDHARASCCRRAPRRASRSPISRACG